MLLYCILSLLTCNNAFQCLWCWYDYFYCCFKHSSFSVSKKKACLLILILTNSIFFSLPLYLSPLVWSEISQRSCLFLTFASISPFPPPNKRWDPVHDPLERALTCSTIGCHVFMITRYFSIFISLDVLVVLGVDGHFVLLETWFSLRFCDPTVFCVSFSIFGNSFSISVFVYIHLWGVEHWSWSRLIPSLPLLFLSREFIPDPSQITT